MYSQSLIPKNSKPLSRAEKQRFYNRSAWRRLRKKVLAEQPLCRSCLELARMTPSTVCDHVNPLWNSWDSFLAGPFQGLCHPCHREKLEEDLAKKRKAKLFEVRAFS